MDRGVSTKHIPYLPEQRPVCVRCSLSLTRRSLAHTEKEYQQSMTDNNTYREKGRAVFLAAIMVLSVVAMTATLAAPAAATVTTADRTIEDATLAPGESTTVTVEVQLDSNGFPDVTEQFDSAFESVEVINTSPGADFELVNDANTEVFASWATAETDTATLEYEVTVPASASDGDTFTITGEASDDDGTATVAGPDTITVEEAAPPAEASVTFEDQLQPQPVNSVLVQNAVPGDDGEFLAIWSVTDEGNPDEILGVGTEFGEALEVALDSELEEEQTLAAAVHPALDDGSADTETILALDTAVVTPAEPDATQTNEDVVNTYWQGQIISFGGDFDIGQDYQVREVDGAGEDREVGSLAREVRSTAENTLIVRTNLLDEGNFVIEDENNALANGDPLPTELSNYDGFAFEIAEQTLEANDVPSSIIQDRDLVVGEIQSNRAGYDLTVTAVDENGAVAATDSLTDLGDFEENVELDLGLAPGDYTLNFDVTDTTASDTAELTVNPPLEDQVQFDADLFEENRGDIGTITLTTEGLSSSDRFWVRIGDEAGVNYETVLEVSPTIPEPVSNPEVGRVVINLNTFLAGGEERLGTSISESDAYSASLGTIHDVNRTTEDPVPRVLDPTNYELEALAEDPTELDDQELPDILDVSVLNVQPSDVNNVQAWTSPRGTTFASALQNELLAQSGEVSLSDNRRALSDTAIYEINVEGVYGALAFLRDAGETDTTVFEQAVASPSGPVLAFDYRQLNPDDNRGPKRMGNYVGHGDAGAPGDGIAALQETIDRGALTSTIDAANDTIYLTMGNIGNAEVYTQQNPTEEINIGDNFQISANWGLGLVNEFNEEDIEALSGDRQQSDTQNVVDRTALFDGVRLDDGSLLIQPAPVEDATISGTTSVADNTVLNLRVTSPDADQPLFQTRDVVVQDGEFEATFDFSDFDEGTNITAVIPGQGFQDNAETAGELIDPEAPFFEVSNLNPQDVSVEQGAVIDVSATVTNSGGQEGTQTVEFRVGGDALVEQDVTLAPGESTTVEFTGIDTSSLDGEFTHGIYTDNDQQEATLTVNAPEPASFGVEGLNPTEATITAGDTVTVSAVVSNEGDVEATQTIQLLVDGEAVAEQELTLAGGDFEVVSFGPLGGDLSPGDYTHAIASDDATVEGSLTVEEEPEPPSTDDDTTDGDEDADDGGPGFGIAAALIALLGAALLARRRA
ncbi:MAG: BGTF surface domain-containing protein [Halovenus sp.]